MRIIYGLIGAQGQILSHGGDGDITVTKTGPGIYDIHFKTDYQNLPSVTATQLYESDRESGGNTLDNVVMVKVTKHIVRLKTGDSEGNARDRKFSFIAIGD